MNELPKEDYQESLELLRKYARDQEWSQNEVPQHLVEHIVKLANCFVLRRVTGVTRISAFNAFVRTVNSGVHTSKRGRRSTFAQKWLKLTPEERKSFQHLAFLRTFYAHYKANTILEALQLKTENVKMHDRARNTRGQFAIPRLTRSQALADVVAKSSVTVKNQAKSDTKSDAPAAEAVVAAPVKVETKAVTEPTKEKSAKHESREYDYWLHPEHPTCHYCRRPTRWFATKIASFGFHGESFSRPECASCSLKTHCIEFVGDGIVMPSLVLEPLQGYVEATLEQVHDARAYDFPFEWAKEGRGGLPPSLTTR